MKNNYREDGFVWFEDQISELADLLLNVQGLAHIYKKKTGNYKNMNAIWFYLAK